jgi:hypothetical protein
MNKNDIRDLYIHAFKGTSPDVTRFSVADVKDTLVEELRALAPNKYEYEKNKLDIFQIVQETFDEVLPSYVGNFIGQFAEIKSVGNCQRASFIVKRGRRRAKTFVTEVGLAGVYEAFRLDVDTFEVSAKAYGGAAYVDFERMLDGSENLTEPLQLLLEGLEEAIYRELLKALIAATNNADMPTANKVSTNTFDPEAMQRLCTIAKNYGGGSAVIFASPEFVQSMGPDAIGMPVYGQYALTASPTAGSAPGYATPVYNPRNIEEIAQYGRIKTFRGTPIVELPQSFTDERNETYVMNPAAAYIFPNGDNKPVKVVFEGPAQVDEWQHRDRSFEVEVYTRVGVAIITNHDWCVYINGELMDPEKYPTQYELVINDDTFDND